MMTTGTGTDGIATWATPDTLTQLGGRAVTSAGGNQPHDTMQPYVTLNFSTHHKGIYPAGLNRPCAERMSLMASPNVSVSVQGQLMYTGIYLSIGDQSYAPTVATPANAYWIIVVDLTSLAVVVNDVVTDNTQVPASLQPYVNNPQYMLILTTSQLTTDNVPQGNFYAFLQSTGAGPKLARAEQINEQLGTGTIGMTSYILAATLEQSDGGGFEELDFFNLTVMTFQLLPVTVNGQTIYTPIQTGA